MPGKAPLQKRRAFDCKLSRNAATAETGVYANAPSMGGSGGSMPASIFNARGREEMIAMSNQAMNHVMSHAMKWIVGDLGARNHDLVDPGGELLQRSGEDQPAEMAPRDRAHAHRAGFARGVGRAAAQCGAAVIGEAAADRRHFPMCGQVVIGLAEIARER